MIFKIIQNITMIEKVATVYNQFERIEISNSNNDTVFFFVSVKPSNYM
jgi:hypothetical protein